MKTVILRLLKDLNPESLRLLKALEQEGELRAGFVKELAWELAKERFGLASAMMQSISAVASPAASDIRTSVSRAYYSCHHACRAALMAKVFLDYRDHYVVIDQMQKWGKVDAVWRPAHATIKDLIDRRHLADYDPYDSGSDGILPVLPIPTEVQIIAELRNRSEAVVKLVEVYLKNIGVLP